METNLANTSWRTCSMTLMSTETSATQEKQNMLGDKTVRSVWSDKDKLTFCKLIH